MNDSVINIAKHSCGRLHTYVTITLCALRTANDREDRETMNTVYIPEGYRPPCLNSYDTQLAIGMTKLPVRRRALVN